MKENTAILDVELEMLLIRKSFSEQNPGNESYRVDLDEKFNIAIQFSGDLSLLEQLGFKSENITGDISFGTADLTTIEQLAVHPNISKIELQQSAHILLNDSVPDIQANGVWSRNDDQYSGYTGKGVLIGIIDTGLHFRHENFIRPDGTTRVHKIWDQTIIPPLNPPQSGESSPAAITHSGLQATLGYGVEYNSSNINFTLGVTPLPPAANRITVRHTDQNGHGTHVAGIAAGDGSQSGGCRGDYTYIGVAPDADLIIVRKWGLTVGDNGSTQTPPVSVASPASNTLVDAIKYILNEARLLGRPVVINCSIGTFSEKMDGSSTTSQAIDTLLANPATGKSIVFAAGNDGNHDFRADGTVPINSNSLFVLRFQVFPGDTRTRSIVINYQGSNLQAKLSSPVGGTNGTINWSTTGIASSTTINGTNGSAIIINNNNQIKLSLFPPTNQSNLSGTWTIELRNHPTNGASTTTNVMAFCLAGSSHDPRSIKFLNNTTVRSTLNEYATGPEVLSVGAYEVDEGLAPFSSRGPTTDTLSRTKPEICAPGVQIKSTGIPKDLDADGCAACCCDCCEDFYVLMDGTSMAAPHVAGVIALMLHKNPNLSHRQIKTILTSNGNFNGPLDNPSSDDLLGWGVGRVSTTKAMAAVTEVNPPETVAFVAEERNVPAFSLMEQFLSTTYGQRYYDLALNYFQEIMVLINSNKRVATVWHRCRGPVWTRLAIKASNYPHEKLPFIAHGIHIKDSIKDFGAIVKKHASKDLFQAITFLEPQLQMSIHENISLLDFLDILGNQNPEPSSSKHLK